MIPRNFITILLYQTTVLQPVFAINLGASCRWNCSCSDPEFQCPDRGNCIPLAKRCDGHVDCYNGADEERCSTCAAGLFLCANGNCIGTNWLCDGEDDCGDNSDEANCRPCPFEDRPFACDNSRRCIAMSLVCNGVSDCSDEGNDEVGCARCSYGAFHCSNNKCISPEWQCDGENDCGDNSDERNCTSFCPAARPYLCNGSTKCIAAHFKCDGISQCDEGSDERNCIVNCPTDRAYLCANSSQCIDLRNATLCGSQIYCLNGADRMGCPSCALNQFKCRGGKCIDASSRCNGREDCPQGEDELHCDSCINAYYCQEIRGCTASQTECNNYFAR